MLGDTRFGLEVSSQMEQEIADWEARIKEKEAEAESLTLEIRELSFALNQFQIDYHLKIGVLYAQLDRIKLQIEEYRHRHQTLRGRQGATTEDLAQVEEVVKTTFDRQRRKVDDFDQQTEQAQQNHARYAKLEKEKVELADEVKEDLKNLYRGLSIKYHPDKAKDEPERERFHVLMVKINQAYEDNDRPKLRELMDQAEREEAIKSEMSSEKLARLKQDYQKTIAILDQLKREIQQIRENKTYCLRTSVQEASEQGRDLLQELAENISREIEQDQTSLNELIEEYRLLINEMAY